MSSVLLLCAVLLGASSDGLGTARAAHAQVEQALGQAHAEVVAGEGTLHALTQTIAEEKARRSGAPSLFVPATLESHLAESQRQAEALARARDREAALSQQAAQAREALYRALTQEIALREPGARDAAALNALQALQAERASVAPAGPGAVAAPAFQGGTDDPRELHERADALRDQADKLGRQATALDARIEAARQQQRLEKQLRRLTGSEGLFDETDRRVRLTRSDATGAAADRPAGGTRTTGTVDHSSPSASLSSAHPPSVDHSTAPSVGLNPGGTTPPAANSAPVPAPRTDAPAPSLSAPSSEQVGHASGEVVRPEELESRGNAPELDDESLESMLRARTQVQQRRQALEAQAKQLDASIR
jgi:hypothetical protein